MNKTAENNTRATPYFIIKIILTIILLLGIFYFPALLEKQLLHQFINGALTFLIPSLIISITRVIIISLYNARHGRKKVRGNFILGINQLTVVLNGAIFILALMVGFGINPIDFLTSMTIVAMAIAVTFRDYITNMISGLFIMFSDQLSIGDRVKVADNKGRVQDLTLSNIVLKNEEDDIVMVPNNFFYNQPVINLSVHRSQYFYVQFELPFQMARYADQLEKDLIEYLRTLPELEDLQETKLQVEEIAKDFVRFKIELMAASSSDRVHREIEKHVLKKILHFKNNYQ
ncbi:MAG TPA: mechanosensitive ion channel [Niabella sp.]|nr:mechanosensitive ion channel [Niabella sp.]HQW13541.1 mechanosensitive ion channel [Niabella sp.]HQX18935.1 mechanosensitive ion channel [Niabella sp.]HQX40440.1 mechanosensitive ion channel [Niabella sp.]HRB07707.1 mechanosensitive ion channel [Niabella sp.]